VSAATYPGGITPRQDGCARSTNEGRPDRTRPVREAGETSVDCGPSLSRHVRSAAPLYLLGILLFETSLTSLAQVGSGWAYFSAALVSGFVPPVSLSLCRSCGLELRTGANLAASSHLAVSHRRESQAQQAGALGKVRFLQKPLSCRCASGSGQTGASSQGRRS
jgi:hypothetical protein